MVSINTCNTQIMQEKYKKMMRKNCQILIYLNPHLVKDNQIPSIEKLNAKELYSLSVSIKNKNGFQI